MIPTNKVEKHMELCRELNRIYDAKNHDYGDSFGKSFQESGLEMAKVRLSDKLNRFKSLAGKDPGRVDESIRDTLMDLANYAIMTVLEMDQTPVVTESPASPEGSNAIPSVTDRISEIRSRLEDLEKRVSVLESKE